MFPSEKDFSIGDPQIHDGIKTQYRKQRIMTLEGQYKLYLEEHPESTFTFEEWNIWWSKKLFQAIEKYEQSNNGSNTE